MYKRLTLFFLLSCIAITYAKPTAEISSPKAKKDALGGLVASFRPETILTVRGMAHADGKTAKRSFDLLDEKGAVVHSLRDVLAGTDEYLPAVTHDGVLAKLDLSVVRNGIYALRMSVEAEGVTETTEVPIAVCGMNKIGAFRWKSRDLTLKVGKESLTVSRRYDSMDKDGGPDLGPGWRLSTFDVAATEYHRNGVHGVTVSIEGIAKEHGDRLLFRDCGCNRRDSAVW